jgi:hypothetical protein
VSWPSSGAGSGTVSGSHGPSSSSTCLSTHDQAASPSSRYASLFTTRTRYNWPLPKGTCVFGPMIRRAARVRTATAEMAAVSGMDAYGEV